MNGIALLDANALYPAPIRDLLLELAEASLFQPRWTHAIQEEWTGSLLRRQRMGPAALARTRAIMEASFPNCLVNGYEELIPQVALPDPGDRHVLAAAIAGNCSVIVTQNLRDFPASALAPHEIVAQHPDGFLSDLLARAPESFCTVVGRIRARLQKPPYTAAEYLANLEQVGLASTAARLAGHRDVI